MGMRVFYMFSSSVKLDHTGNAGYVLLVSKFFSVVGLSLTSHHCPRNLTVWLSQTFSCCTDHFSSVYHSL